MEQVTKGAGMIAGLEMWRSDGKFILVDNSPDGRFANDVSQWNSAASDSGKRRKGLNIARQKKTKNAEK